MPFTIFPFENILLALLQINRSFTEKVIPSCYLFSTPSFRQTERWGGIKFDLDVSNYNDHEVYFYQPPAHLKSILPYISDQSVIVDVGTNMGSSLLYMLTNTKCKLIIGFEPDPQNYKKAIQNLRLNTELEERAIIENLGVGNKNETKNLYKVAFYNSGMNRIEVDDPDKYESSKISLVSLDTYVKTNSHNNISAIKIDVEGYEMKVLLGASETIDQNRPVILLELCDENLLKCDSSALSIYDFLQKKSYRILNANTLKPVKKEQLAGCYLDIICIPE